MKLLATLSAGLLFLILGAATRAHSQEQKEEAKPGEAHPGAVAPRPESRPEMAAPAPRQEAAPPRGEPRPQAEPARPAAPNPREERAPQARPAPEPAARP